MAVTIGYTMNHLTKLPLLSKLQIHYVHLLKTNGINENGIKLIGQTNGEMNETMATTATLKL